MNGKSELLGKEVTLVTLHGDEHKGFLAFCDDSKGLVIKFTDSERDDFCHNIKEWDKKREWARAIKQPMLYRCNGKYAHEYLKECIRAGIIHSAFVDDDLRNDTDVRGLHAQCPSGSVS